MGEQKYKHITFYTTIMFAKELARFNPDMVFFYLSGVYADSSEKENNVGKNKRQNRERIKQAKL